MLKTISDWPNETTEQLTFKDLRSGDLYTYLNEPVEFYIKLNASEFVNLNGSFHKVFKPDAPVMTFPDATIVLGKPKTTK